MKKSGTNTKSNKTETKPQAPKAKQTTPKATPAPQTLTQEEKELTIQLIDTAVYYNDYMLTDLDRKIINEIKRKIWK